MVADNAMVFPSEYVIRIFKGSYPHLNLDKGSFKGKKILDVGCGDGRNLVVLAQAGFDVHGAEVNQEIVDVVRKNMQELSIPAKIEVGTNDSLPFDEGYFDYLLSWNACYYLGENRDFNSHVEEFGRVIKAGGTLVLSIPKKTCFIYKGSDEERPGYRTIKNDPFNVRNGEVLRMFESEKEIEDTFSPYFKDFIFGSIEDDCFGLDYHWHMIVCRKR